ncbi:hypothetical protein BC829DRAFT_419616 [Chytridium lagenaria]|nr:hypothetical protein BC829DRAFT_419616 [Chytridium lagenaria]
MSGRNQLNTPGYGLIPSLGAENRRPDIQDSRCIGKIDDVAGVGCTARDYTSAMNICNDRNDCGGFVCWNTLRGNCYVFTLPLHLGGAGGFGSSQNAYIKVGAEVVQNGVSSTPFPLPSPSPVPVQPPPVQPPPDLPADQPPSDSPSPPIVDQPSSEVSQSGDVSVLTTTEISDAELIDESAGSSDILTSLSGGRTMTALLVAPDAVFRSSSGALLGPDATSGLNGVANSGIVSTGGASSSGPNTFVIGISSVAAGIGVIGAIVFAVFLKRRKTKSVNPVKPMPLSYSTPKSSTPPTQLNGGGFASTYATVPVGYGYGGSPNTTSHNVVHTNAVVGSFAARERSVTNINPAQVAMPAPMSKAAEAFAERSRHSPSPTHGQSSALFSSATVASTPTYQPIAYNARPEKELQHTVQHSYNQAYAPPTRISVVPQYSPPTSLHNVTSPDVKAPLPSRGPMVPFDQPQPPTRAASSGAPIVAAAGPTSLSKSAYISQENALDVHPQRWNTRQTVNWLHGKGIACDIVTFFETNRIRGNELWDMDAYRVSLLGLKASSAEVHKLLAEIQILRDEFTSAGPAGPALPVYRD